MASKFPGDFIHGFMPLPFTVDRRQPFPVPYQTTISIPEALHMSKADWEEIKVRLTDLNSALTKLLGKGTEKPTLGKISSSWNEKRYLITSQETHVMQIFFNTLTRLGKVKDVMPIGQLLKGRCDINTIYSNTTVHSTVHDDITDIVNKGTHIASRFRATVSVIPRLLDCLCPIVGIPMDEIPKKQTGTGGERARSPSPTGQPQNKARRPSGENPAETPPKETRSKETQQPWGPHTKDVPLLEEEVLVGNPDADFQVLQSIDDWWNMQRRVGFQGAYERKCVETNQLRKENEQLLTTLQEKEREMEQLKKQLGPSSDELDTRSSEQARQRQLENQIEDILTRLTSLESDRRRSQSSMSTPNISLSQPNQLDDHLKYFRRRLAEYKPADQTNFIYKSSNFAAGYFDERGGFLEIETLHVSLFVPPGAIQSGKETEVYIFVDTDTSPLPCSAKAQTVVAPVVQCGPPGLQFKESVVLTFPHCADEEINWKFQPMTCQSDTNHQAKGEWTNLTMDDAIYMVEKGRTILLIKHFTFYTLAGEQKDGVSAVKKKMRVGAFGSSFSSGQDSYQFRVRAWDDTEAALDQVLKKERRLSGQQLDDDRPISIANTGEPVDVNVNNLKAGWKNRYDKPHGQQMTFDDLWQPCSLPSCTFDLEVDASNNNQDHTKAASPQVKSGVHCKVDLQQTKSSDSSVNLKIDVHQKTEEEGLTTSSRTGTFSGAVQEKIFGPFDPNSGLSPTAYYNLCEDLNMDRGIAMDWRLLAEKLDCSFLTIESIRGNKTEEPAKLVLKVFFSMWNVSSKKDESAIDFLKNTLVEVGLASSAKIIEDDLMDRQSENANK